MLIHQIELKIAQLKFTMQVKKKHTLAHNPRDTIMFNINYLNQVHSSFMYIHQYNTEKYTYSWYFIFLVFHIIENLVFDNFQKGSPNKKNKIYFNPFLEEVVQMHLHSLGSYLLEHQL